MRLAAYPIHLVGLKVARRAVLYDMIYTLDAVRGIEYLFSLLCR